MGYLLQCYSNSRAIILKSWVEILMSYWKGDIHPMNAMITHFLRALRNMGRAESRYCIVADLQVIGA